MCSLKRLPHKFTNVTWLYPEKIYSKVFLIESKILGLGPKIASASIISINLEEKLIEHLVLKLLLSTGPQLNTKMISTEVHLNTNYINCFKGQNYKCFTKYEVSFIQFTKLYLYTWPKFSIYRISPYSFRGNYPFLNLEIQRSQYIRPKVIPR